jgi:hypothetical protein
VSTFKPTMRVEDNPTQYLMDFVHENYYAPPAIGQSLFPPFQAHNVWQREHVMRRQFTDTPSNHHPEVYALPRDHDVVPQPTLAPCEDLVFLLDKYRHDVSALTGVPHEMISGRGGGSHETIRKTMASGRIFSTNMHEVCRHLQALLCQVYSRTFPDTLPSEVEFVLVPMPRLEVETIQDIKALHEIGAISPDMVVKLSRVLLGEDPRGGGPKPAKVAKTTAGGKASEKDSKDTGKDKPAPPPGDKKAPELSLL